MGRSVRATWCRSVRATCTAYITDINHHSGMYEKLAAAMHRYRLSAAQVTASEADTSARRSGSSSCGAGSSSSSSSSSAGESSSSSSSTTTNPRRVTANAPQLPALSVEQLQGFDPETVMVGSMLCMDMEKAGIHLETPQRESAYSCMGPAVCTYGL
jgi:hypothetical protein